MGGNLNELEVDAQINQATLLNKELLNKQMQQSFEIQEKEKLLYTRNRMLQLSYEENMFKKKIDTSVKRIILFTCNIIIICCYWCCWNVKS